MHYFKIIIYRQKVRFDFWGGRYAASCFPIKVAKMAINSVVHRHPEYDILPEI